MKNKTRIMYNICSAIYIMAVLYLIGYVIIKILSSYPPNLWYNL